MSCKTDKKNCCPAFPHYTSPITDEDFVERNIQMSDNFDYPFDPMEQLPHYVYPGDLAYDESKTLPKCEYKEWERQQDVARYNALPTKFWQDLNTGRRGYARNLSDNLDLTMNERNNFASGWWNALNKDDRNPNTTPGGAPWRNPYLENHVPYDPQKYRAPLVTNTALGNRQYFYSIYDLDDIEGTNVVYCKCPQSPQMLLQMKTVDWRKGQTCPDCGKKQMMRYPERYV